MSIGRISTFLDIYVERDLREGTLDAMSIGRISSFLDIYIERGLKEGTLDYDALFSGDPFWVTECVGGMERTGGRSSRATPTVCCTR